MLIAHKREEDDALQTILEHLKNTALLAQKFAHSFNGDNYAYTTALLHDIGKYSKEFQNRILHNGKKCDHSTAGAKEIYKLNRSGKLMAYCIAGHHSGLPNCGSITDVGIEGTLNARLNKKAGDIPLYDQFANEIDFNKIHLPVMPDIKYFNKNNRGFILSFYVRFIYSCLVDADFLDTEAFMNNNSIDRSVNYDFKLFQKKLNDKLKGFKGNSKINEYRASILNSCIEKAAFERGLFNLTVPTGGGKTISSLAFAVNHLIKNSMDRIIYVIPYTSIIEQNAKEFKNIFDNENVLEHPASTSK